MSRSGALPQVLLWIALSGALFWVLSLRRQVPESRSVSSTLAPSSDFGSPTRFAFRDGGDSVVVVREGGRWRITHPLRDLASPFTMEEIWRQIGTLRASRVLPDKDAARFGLAPPRRGVAVEDEAGRRWRLEIGDSAAVASAYYARTTDGTRRIVLVDRYATRRYLMPLLRELREPIPAPLPPGPLDSIWVETRESRLRAVRRRAELWESLEPRGLGLDPLRINRALERLRQPTLQDFAHGPINRKLAGLDPPRARWVLFHGGEAETVNIGHPTPDERQVFCEPARRELSALMSSDFYRDLVDGWPALADLRLTRIPFDSIESVTAFEPGSPGYERAGAGWKRVPEGHAVRDAEGTSRAIQNLTLVQWRRYPRAERAPDAGARLALRVATATRAETLLFSSPIDSTVLARSTLRARWGEVSPTAWNTWSYRILHPEL